MQRNLNDPKQDYLDRLAFLIQHFGNERKERFYPFYLIFKGEREHCRFEEALNIGKYFLDNMFLNTEDAELFFRTLKKLIEKYQATDSGHWESTS